MRAKVEPHFPCPACGFIVLTERYGSYDICPQCGWEDDVLQLVNPTSGGGANEESLHECQMKALGKYPLSIGEAAGYARSNEWRPLTAVEVEIAERRREQEHWHTSVTHEPGDAYWKHAT